MKDIRAWETLGDIAYKEQMNRESVPDELL